MNDNKINIDLIVPSIGEKYNVFIPVNKTIGEVIVILNNTINNMTGCFPMNNNLSVLNVIECKLYDINMEVKKAGIKNGALLALI